MNRLKAFVLFLFISLSCFSQNTPLLQEAYNKLNNRNFEGALQDFNKVLSDYPKNYDALCGRAETRIALGNTAEATMDLEEAIKADANNARAFVLKGDILFNHKDYTNALKSYEDALPKQGAPNPAIIGKAKSWYQLGKVKEAFELLEKSTEKYPSSADIYYARGLLYNINQKHSKALADFDKAITLNPDYNPFGLYFNRGLAYYNLEEYPNSIEDFDKAIEVDPRNATAYHSRGLAYYQSEAYQEAIENFIKSSEINSNNSATYYNLGMAYSKMEDTENACLNFRKACQMKNTNACKMIVLTCENK